jgi:hypothetical protein
LVKDNSMIAETRLRWQTMQAMEVHWDFSMIRASSAKGEILTPHMAARHGQAVSVGGRASIRSHLPTTIQWTACTAGSGVANRRSQAARAASATAAVSWRAMATYSSAISAIS